jgi:hypothetical protein
MSNVKVRRWTAASLLLASSLAALTGALALWWHAEEFHDKSDRAYAGVEFGAMDASSLLVGYRYWTGIVALLGVALLGAAILTARVPETGRVIPWLVTPAALVFGALPALYGYVIVLHDIELEPPDDREVAAQARLRSDLAWLHTGAWHSVVVVAGLVMMLATVAAAMIVPRWDRHAEPRRAAVR